MVALPPEGECMCGDTLDIDGVCPRCDGGIGVDVEYADCSRCGAIRVGSGRCWFCDRNWIWSGP